MKKTKFLALVLVVAIMMMGAGYAYWSDTLVVNHTVKTGEFNVEFIQPKSAEIWNWKDYNYETGQYSDEISYYVKAELSDRTAKKVEFNIENLYPGASYGTVTKMQNKGTIPAVFDSAVVTYKDNKQDILIDNLLIEFVYCKVYGLDGQEKKYDISPIWNTNLKKLDSELNEVLKGVKLEPGDELVLGGESVDQYMKFTLNEELGNDDGKAGEKGNLKFSITVNWKQHNAK